MEMTNDRITQVSIKNYRSLQDVSVQLGRLNVLVGLNGSGKSNFIDALHFVADALRLGLDAAFTRRGTARLLGLSGHYGMSFTLQLEVAGITRIYSFTLAGPDPFHVPRTVKHERYVSGNATIFERDENGWIKAPEQGYPLLQENSLILPVLAGLRDIQPAHQFLTGVSFYNISPKDIRDIQRRNYAYPLDEKGENLASVLEQFLKSSPWATDLTNSFKLIAPHVDDLTILPQGDYLRIAFKLGVWVFDAMMESDGTLRVLALLTALYQDPPRALLAFEEPELFVHPGALAALCDVIKEASMRSQIILATHSPDLISRFDVDSLLVVERTEQGTQIGPIDNIQRQAVIDQLFSAGDLLYVEGLRRASSTSHQSL